MFSHSHHFGCDTITSFFNGEKSNYAPKPTTEPGLKMFTFTARRRMLRLTPSGAQDPPPRGTIWTPDGIQVRTGPHRHSRLLRCLSVAIANTPKHRDRQHVSRRKTYAEEP